MLLPHNICQQTVIISFVSAWFFDWFCSSGCYLVIRCYVVSPGDTGEFSFSLSYVCSFCALLFCFLGTRIVIIINHNFWSTSVIGLIAKTMHVSHAVTVLSMKVVLYWLEGRCNYHPVFLFLLPIRAPCHLLTCKHCSHYQSLQSPPLRHHYLAFGLVSLLLSHFSRNFEWLILIMHIPSSLD